MAELTQKERLQPSLLDRLTDDAPSNKRESRDKRVLSLSRLRAAVVRDLAWLLNTSDLGTTEDLEAFPEVARSVLNYGMTDLSGSNASSVETARLEQRVRQAILDFEPRIMPKSVKVTALMDADEVSHNALTFEIEGTLWAQPAPLRLFLKTEVDLETGNTVVTDQDASGRV